MARSCFVLVVFAGLLGSGISTSTDCAHVALADVPVELHCQTNCTPSRNTVTWCLHSSQVFFGNLQNWSVCINSTGQVRGGNVPQELLNSHLRESGTLYIPKVNVADVTLAPFNCTVVNEEGGVCGYEEFNLTVYTYPTNPFDRPRLYDDGEDVVQVEIGTTEVLCFIGRSPGSNGDTYWTKGETVISSLNISDYLDCSGSSNCYSCIEELLSVPVVTQTESHYASFHVAYSTYFDELVNECSEPNRFISFLVISQVAPEDAGEYGFVFTSLRNQFTETHKVVNTVYVQEKPTFHHPQDHEKSVIKDSNAFIICNATTSHDATLQWTVFDDDSVIQDVSDVIQQPVTLDDNTLTDLCSTTEQRLSFTLSQVDTPRDSDGATLLLQQSALVLCNAQYSHTGTYICMASGSTLPSQALKVEVVEEDSTEEPPAITPTEIIAIFISVTALILFISAGMLPIIIYVMWRLSHLEDHQNVVVKSPCSFQNII